MQDLGSPRDPVGEGLHPGIEPMHTAGHLVGDHVHAGAARGLGELPLGCNQCWVVGRADVHPDRDRVGRWTGLDDVDAVVGGHESLQIGDLTEQAGLARTGRWGGKVVAAHVAHDADLVGVAQRPDLSAEPAHGVAAHTGVLRAGLEPGLRGHPGGNILAEVGLPLAQDAIHAFRVRGQR